MPKTLLGIQLRPAEALAVHLKGGWKGATVDRIARIDLTRAPPGEKALPLREAALPAADSVVTALPADAVFQRQVELPFTDRLKVEQAAPLEAEETLPLPLEDLVAHLHVLERSGGRTRALLAAAPRPRVAELLELLREAGLEPDVIDVEPLALTAVARRALPEDTTAVLLDLSPVLCQGLLLRPDGPSAFHAFSADGAGEDLYGEVRRYLDHWSQESISASAVFLSGPLAAGQDLDAWSKHLGVPVRQLPFPTEGLSAPPEEVIPWPGWAIPLGLALREGYAKGASQVNLRQGPFAPQRETGPWKKLAIAGGIYLGVLFALWGASTWSETSYRNAQYEALRGSIREVFREALPDVTNIVSEIDQMRARVNELETRAASLGSLVDREVSPLRILREISQRIPKDQEVEFRDFIVEEGRVRLEGVTTSFDAIDKISAELAQYPRFDAVTVSDAKQGIERNKVVFKLTINLGRKS